MSLIAVALYTALAILAIASWYVVTLAFAVPTGHNLLVAATYALPCVAIAVYLARRDPVVFRRCVLWAGVFGFPITFLSEGWEPHFFQALCVFAVLGSAAHMLRERRRGAASAGAVLFEAIEAGVVYEMEGVHLAFEAVRSAPAGGLARVAFGLQNCWSAPRKVEVRVEPENGPPLRAPLVISRRLAGGEAGVLQVHALLPVDHAGTYDLLLDVAVSGWGGRRIVPRRGEPFANKVTPGEQVVRLALGHVVWGGGLRLRIQVVGTSRIDGLPPPPQWKPLTMANEAPQGREEAG